MATLTYFGFRLIDIGGSSNEKAPMLHKYKFSCIAPDALAFLSGPLWVECKTKSAHNKWRGGAQADPIRFGPCAEEGIDREKYEAYLRVQKDTGVPVVLLILSIKEGELVGNTLRGLGEPRFSPNPNYDLVNWDVYKFRRICQYDCVRLRKYFYNKDGGVIQAPTDMPSDQQRRQAVERLKPQQGEFDLIILDAVAQMERDWQG